MRQLRLRVVYRLLAALLGVVLAAGPTLAVCLGAPAGDGCHECCAAGAPDQPRTVVPPVTVHAPLTPAIALPLPWAQTLPLIVDTPPIDGTPPIPILLQTTVLLV